MKLTDCRETKAEVYRLESLLERLKVLSESCPQVQYDGMPRSRSRKSPVEAVAVKICDVENQLESARRRLVEQQAELTEKIFRCCHNSTTAEILCMRYVQFQPFKKIAAELNYSEQNIFVHHKRGVDSFKAVADTGAAAAV